MKYYSSTFLRLALITTAAATLSGCFGLGDSIRNLAIDKPSNIGKQPVHVLFNKNHLQLKGNVKEVTYSFLRLGPTGQQENTKVTFTFDKKGRIETLEGNQRALDNFGLLKFVDIPNYSEFDYAGHGGIKNIEHYDKDKRQYFKAKPQLFGKKTGNLRSITYNRTDNKKTNAERSYRTLEHMVYAGNRYLQLTVNNEDPDYTHAKVVSTLNNRLLREYDRVAHYDTQKNKHIDVINAPLNHEFKLIREQRYDRLGRLVERVVNKQGGNYVIRDNIRYRLKGNEPEQIVTRDSVGMEKRRAQFSAYQTDAQDNWISRTSVVMQQGSERAGKDTRTIEYYN